MNPIEEAQLVLENDGTFHSTYQRELLHGFAVRDSQKASRRIEIRRAVKRLDMELAKRCSFSGGDGDAAEQMRLYFDARYAEATGYEPSPGDQVAALKLDPHKFHQTAMDKHIDTALQTHAAYQINMIKQPEILMSKFFETKQFVNGTDLSTMSSTAIYAAIRAKETQVADLETIKNQPKKLKREIAEIQAEIKTLVDFLDSKEPSTGETSAS